MVQKIIHRFGDLDAVVNATDEELAVGGRGWDRPAREIREGLRTLQEVDIVDRYPLNQTAAPAAVSERRRPTFLS